MRTRHKIIAAAVVSAGALAVYTLLPSSCPEAARRTAVVFVLAAGFWSAEIIPLFVTSLLAVLLLMIGLAGSAGVLGPDGSAHQMLLLPLLNPVILLFLGGFVLAQVLRQEGVDRILAGRLTHLFGKKPYPVLLGFILATGFVSFWISNTTAAALMLAVIAPILTRLDADDRYKKALVLGVAFAASIGGIGTPVGTPPNGIAIGILAERGIHISFLSWVRMGVPLAVVLLVFLSVLLYRIFPPKRADLIIETHPSEPLRPRSGLALTVAGMTVAFWLTTAWHGIPESVVSLLAIGVFAVLGYLNIESIRKIHWDILILMWGGLALGIAMEKSGLGAWLVTLPIFSHQGPVLVAVFCLATIFLSALISNTAAASLMLPIAMSIPDADWGVLAVIIALASSFDMILPISTPPNALAFSTRVITVRDLFLPGVILVAAAAALLILGHPIFIRAGLGL